MTDTYTHGGHYAFGRAGLDNGYRFYSIIRVPSLDYAF